MAAAVAPDRPGPAALPVGRVLLRPGGKTADAVRDVLRGVVASAQEPIAGGRHKVFGNAELNIVPTTSTIASHLPRAVGLAYSLALPAAGSRWPDGAIVVASFGDASANHAAPPRRSTRRAGSTTQAYGCRCS